MDGTGRCRKEEDKERKPRMKMRTFSEAEERATNSKLLARKEKNGENREPQNRKGQGMKATMEGATTRTGQEGSEDPGTWGQESKGSKRARAQR